MPSGSVFVCHCQTILAEGQVGIPYSLPKTIVTGAVEISATNDTSGTFTGYEAVLELSPEFVSDPTLQYTLQLNTSHWGEDDFNVAVDDRGLLTSVTAISTNQTLEIFDALSKSFAAATKLGTVGGLGFAPAGNAEDRIARYLQNSLQRIQGRHEFTIDLSNPQDIQLGHNSGWLVEVEVIHFDEPRTSAPTVPLPAGTPPSGGAGIYVRPAKPIFLRASLRAKPQLAVDVASFNPVVPIDEILTLALKSGLAVTEVDGVSKLGFPDPVAVAGDLISVPNFSPIVSVPLERPVLASATHTIVLERGMLRTVHAEVGSSALTIVKLPGVIATELVKLPAEIIQLKVQIATGQQNLVTQEQASVTMLEQQKTGQAQANLESQVAYVEAVTEGIKAKNDYDAKLAGGATADVLADAASAYWVAALNANSAAKAAMQPDPFPESSLPPLQ